MKLKFIYKVFPVLILRNNLVPKNFWAISLLFVINIIPAVEDKYIPEIIAHELTHIRQMWRSCLLFVPLYFISYTSRMKYEAEAYANQLRSPGAIKTYEENLQILIDDYSLPYSPSLIKRCLDSYLKG